MIEPAAGVDRCVLAFLLDAYAEDEAPNAKGEWRSARCCGSTRGWHRSRSPCCRCRVTPTCRRRRAICRLSCGSAGTSTSTTQAAIGRRYRRQDEIGTPYCVTVDFETLEDEAVTIRERDTMKQERVGLDAVVGYLSERLLDL